jgi:integrase
MASVDKRPNGSWRARWREYPGGPQRAKAFARKVDAEQFLVRVQSDLQRGSYVNPTMGRTTIASYYAEWFARQPWRDSSRASVGSLFANHVLPVFGPRPIGSVRRGDIEAWAAQLALQPSTARLAVQYLGTMLESAVADGLLAANPVRHVKRPKVEAVPVIPFTAEQLEALTEAAPDWFRVAVVLGTTCGLRQGEATGLTIDRVDFLRRELRVDRQLVTPAAGDPALGPPKTSRSYRTVPLADVALEGIAQHVEHFGTGEHDVVIHESGRPVRRQRFGQVWRSLRKRAGLPNARFHDCRHTFASTLLSGGVPVPAAAEYLGHSPAVLLRTYAHLLPADHDRARSVVQAAFARPTEDNLRTDAAL